MRKVARRGEMKGILGIRRRGCGARDGTVFWKRRWTPAYYTYYTVKKGNSGPRARFRIHGKDYGIAYLGGMSFADNSRAVRLSRFRLHPQESFRYEYDFIANW